MEPSVVFYKNAHEKQCSISVGDILVETVMLCSMADLVELSRDYLFDPTRSIPKRQHQIHQDTNYVDLLFRMMGSVNVATPCPKNTLLSVVR